MCGFVSVGVSSVNNVLSAVLYSVPVEEGGTSEHDSKGTV